MGAKVSGTQGGEVETAAEHSGRSLESGEDQGECRRSTDADCEEGLAGWCEKAMMDEVEKEVGTNKKTDEDGQSFNSISSLLRPLFQSLRASQIPCFWHCSRPTMAL